MAQSITLLGATYNNVSEVQLPKSTSGTALFRDEDEIITYYVGSGAPSSSLGQNGDIYLRTS